jgi:hypothetical protein
MPPRVLCICIAVAFATGSVPTFGADKPETSHLAFVTEYIRELAAFENIRDSGEEELKQSKDGEVFPSAIHNSTLIQLELRSQISRLKSMRLKPPFAQLIPDLTDLYKQKITLHQQLIDIGSAFIAGDRSLSEYGNLAAEIPKIRAELEFIDHTLFNAAPLIFSTLIDKRPDSKNQASHLVITRADRTKLIEKLTDTFGSKLDQKDQNYTVSSASVLKAYLLKDFKCSDDPWE